MTLRQRPDNRLRALLNPQGVQGHVKALLAQAVEELHIPHAPSVAEWVTISAGGVTVVPPAGSSYGFYLQIADTMLYDAKKHGRNRVVWADEQLRQLWEKSQETSGDTI